MPESTSSRVTRLELGQAVHEEKLTRLDVALELLNDHLDAVVKRLDRLTIAVVVLVLGSEQGADLLGRMLA